MYLEPSLTCHNCLCSIGPCLLFRLQNVLVQISLNQIFLWCLWFWLPKNRACICAKKLYTAFYAKVERNKAMLLRFLRTSRIDSNCPLDICPGNICSGNICPIPAQTGDRITDMQECNESFLSVHYWPTKRRDVLQWQW